jgi:intracellular septation protein A
MQWQLLFVSIPPIVAFVAFSRVGTLSEAVLGTAVVSGFELVYNSLQLGIVEPFSLCSFVLFLGFGGVSLRQNDDRYLKLQPVAFELVVAATLAYFVFVLDTPLLAVFAKDYVGIHAELEAYQRGYATIYATTLSKSLPFLLVLHAALTARAAWRRSTCWWFNVRVFGLYGLVALLFLGERLLGVTP